MDQNYFHLNSFLRHRYLTTANRPKQQPTFYKNLLVHLHNPGFHLQRNAADALTSDIAFYFVFIYPFSSKADYTVQGGSQPGDCPTKAGNTLNGCRTQTHNGQFTGTNSPRVHVLVLWEET